MARLLYISLLAFPVVCVYPVISIACIANLLGLTGVQTIIIMLHSGISMVHVLWLQQLKIWFQQLNRLGK